MPEIMELMEDWKGYVALSDVKKPENYDQRLKEVYDLLSNARGLASWRHTYALREALTTSDFPYLFGDVVDRQVLAAYQAIEPEWKKYLRVGTVNRLYPWVGGRRFAIANSGMVLGEVGEKGEYLAVRKTETKYDVYAHKYGNQIDISWESMIADDLGALKNTPNEFAWLVANTEHYYAVDAYANNVGTHAGGDLYEVGSNANTLPLTIANLEATVAAMQAFRHPSGQPMRNKPRYLVVSDGGLEFTALQILTSANKMWLADSDDVTPPAAYPMTNVIAKYGLTLVVDPWLSLAGTSGYTKNTWYLFADPKNIAAVECDYLQGHERPEICMKASDKVNIGGGAVSPFDGDFATDNIFYRVRQCFGANKLDWRATYINTVAD